MAMMSFFLAMIFLFPQPEFLNLCFWFIPPSLRGQESSPEFWDKLGKVSPEFQIPSSTKAPKCQKNHPKIKPKSSQNGVSPQVAPAIKEKMMRRGSMMVGYQPHGSRVNFFRQIVTNPAVTRQDLDFFLDEIQELGWDL